MPVRRRQALFTSIDRDALLKRDARFDADKPGRKKRSDAMMYVMAKVLEKWSRYSNVMHGDECNPVQLLRTAKIGDFRRYIEYRLYTGEISKQSSIWTEWKVLLCVVVDETSSDVELQIRWEMHGLLYGRFMDEYDLSLRPREKPVMSVEDLAVTLHHLWTLDQSVFPVERQRIQLAALLLTIAYTSSRPGALVEASCAASSNECLQYKDVRLLVIPDPEKGKGNLLVMELSLIYTKGETDRTARPQKGNPQVTVSFWCKLLFA